MPDTEQPIVVTIAWFLGAIVVGRFAATVLGRLLVAQFQVDDDSGSADLIRFSADIAIGGLAGIFLSSVTAADTLNAVSFACAILLFETLVIRKIVVENAVGNALVAILSGGGYREPPLSRAESLAARGDLNAARLAYEDTIASHPKDVRAYLGLARMLRLQARDYTAAHSVLEHALLDAELSIGMRDQVLRELHEVGRLVSEAPDLLQ